MRQLIYHLSAILCVIGVIVALYIIGSAIVLGLASLLIHIFR